MAALAATAELVAPIDRLEATVGDEFQGVFATFGEAAFATLVVRLRMTGVVDVRCGIGSGEREVFDARRTPMLQDGPAWWSARAAIDVLSLPAHRLRRTWLDGTHLAAPEQSVPLANAYLIVRDALVDRLNDKARAMLLLALQGRTQREIAQAATISESAVSQAFARGVGAVRDAQAMLADLHLDAPYRQVADR